MMFIGGLLLGILIGAALVIAWAVAASGGKEDEENKD